MKEVLPEITQEDPAAAYRKKMFEQRASSTIATIKTSTSEVVNNPDGSVGLRVEKSESSPSQKVEDLSDPVVGFLREKGFEGHPKLDYSVAVKSVNGEKIETVHFKSFAEVKRFFDQNGDKVAVKENEPSYKLDYGPEVYAWSSKLSTEESAALEEGWDKLGLELRPETSESKSGGSTAETEEQDKKRIDQVREELGMPVAEKKEEVVESELEQIPTDYRGLFIYFKENWEPFEKLAQEEFNTKFDEK